MSEVFKILAYPSPGGSRQYRLDQVAKYINRCNNDVLMVVSDEAMNDEALSWADVIILEGTVDPKYIAWAWAYAGEQGKLLVAEFDDYLDVDEKHPLYQEHQRLEASKWSRGLLKVADLVTTTTEPLANVLKGINENVKVLPNCLDMELWGTKALRNTDDEIRIVWAGSSTHKEDLAMLKPAVFALLDKYPNARFFYCGDGNLWKENMFTAHPRTEYVEPVSVQDWPMKFKTLRADLALIPLVDNVFNHCKSNLKWLENAAYSIPCVLSPTVYNEYISAGVNGFIANSTEEFIEFGSRLIESPALRQEIGGKAREELIKNYSIENNWQQWLDTYKTEYAKKQERLTRTQS